MKKYNILHLASFKGNIGDNASHIGFYNILNEIIDGDFIVEQVEIRRLYKNYRGKDKLILNINFIDYVNEFDFVFVGGGGFLDYWVEDSKTGTTFDIDPELLKFIKVPFFITSVGSKPHRNVPTENILKFKDFLVACKKNKNIHILLRNDGSVESIIRDLGNEYLDGISEILDHGFFYNLEEEYPRIIENKYIAINITKDQLCLNSSLRGDIDIDDYHQNLKNVIDYIVDNLKLDVVFVPHIYSDLEAINNLMRVLDDKKIRNNISVAPLLQGNSGANYLFSVYKNAEQIIATRLHANICSLALNKKVVGLEILDRIEYLYRSMRITNSSAPINLNTSKTIITFLNNTDNIDSELSKLKQNTILTYQKLLLS